MFFSFRRTRQPSAGAEAYAFYPSQETPIFSLCGAGFRIRNPISALQPAPFYYPSQVFTTVGLGGVIYATMYTAPLMVPQQG